jgi:hypothetical protein
MTCPKQDEPFHTIDMKQEDRFFYEKDDSSSSPHHSWSSAQTISEPDNFNYMPTQKTQVDEKQVEEEQLELVQPFSDDDDEFDWNDDPDKPKRRPTARQRLQSAMSSTKQCYCCWHYLSPIMKRIIIALLGSMVFIGVGVIVYFTLPEPTQQERDDPNFKNIRSNVQCWLYWSAIMWHLFWMTTFLFDLVPPIVSLWTKKFKGARSEKMKSKMEVRKQCMLFFNDKLTIPS